ncbi:MAG: hypothetical protein Tsb002_04650 [Wenzhouxiangellaceae bacterium]
MAQGRRWILIAGTVLPILQLLFTIRPFMQGDASAAGIGLAKSIILFAVFMGFYAGYRWAQSYLKLVLSIALLLMLRAFYQALGSGAIDAITFSGILVLVYGLSLWLVSRSPAVSAYVDAMQRTERVHE